MIQADDIQNKLTFVEPIISSLRASERLSNVWTDSGFVSAELVDALGKLKKKIVGNSWVESKLVANLKNPGQTLVVSRC